MSDGVAGGMLRKTVAVVDMVGYSSIARMLEQNISAASVSELNKQIQAFMTRALEQLEPAQVHSAQPYTVVARTGDGIILLFDSVDAAHRFAASVQRFAKEHNDQRTESTAQRWFRVGIATGEVSVTPRAGASDEYAGTTIANAVRLEAAAEAGEVMMDDVSFAELSPELRSLYGPEETVHGKRDESFRVRRYVVTPRAVDIGTATAGASHWRTVGAKLLLGAVYLLPLAGLIVWEHRDHLAEFTSSCDAPPDVTHSALYSVPYSYFLSRASGDSVSSVSLVGIPNGLAEIQNNVCMARGYLADLVRSIAAQHPAEIVIDKFFGPSSCKAFPQSTAELLAAVQSTSVPIVVGEFTDDAPAERNGTCLVRKQVLDFASPNVHRGLTRLYTELDKIPLQWPVLNSAAASDTTTSDTLSWTAVKIFAPDFAQRPRMRALVDSSTDTFANLNLELPRETSTQVLCRAGTEQMRSRWSLDCSGPPSIAPLAGKIVLIGSEDLVDQKVVLGSKVWGYDLQGRYIQALLSGAYLRELPR